MKQSTLPEHTPPADDDDGDGNGHVYTVTANHPIDSDPTTLTTADESWALWWVWHRDAHVTDETGQEMTDRALWDRLGNGGR